MELHHITIHPPPLCAGRDQDRDQDRGRDQDRERDRDQDREQDQDQNRAVGLISPEGVVFLRRQ